jgi:hypothetical protein
MLPDQKQPVTVKAIAPASVESAPVSVEAITAVVPEVVEQFLLTVEAVLDQASTVEQSLPF